MGNAIEKLLVGMLQGWLLLFITLYLDAPAWAAVGFALLAFLHGTQLTEQRQALEDKNG